MVKEYKKMNVRWIDSQSAFEEYAQVPDEAVDQATASVSRGMTWLL